MSGEHRAGHDVDLPALGEDPPAGIRELAERGHATGYVEVTGYMEGRAASHVRVAMGDFDFLVGTWHVANRRLKRRLRGCAEWEEFTATSVCRSAFGGSANVDEIAFADGTFGLTVRMFDSRRREWSLYWASSTTGTIFPPVVGRFSGGVGEFYGDDTQDGTPVRVRFIWSGITPTSARWEQAFSVDGGATWETNWIMEMTRV